MKKTVAAVVILLLAALGGLGYVLFGMEEDPFGPEAVAVNQPPAGREIPAQNRCRCFGGAGL